MRRRLNTGKIVSFLFDVADILLQVLDEFAFQNEIAVLVDFILNALHEG